MKQYLFSGTKYHCYKRSQFNWISQQRTWRFTGHCWEALHW